MYSHKNMRIVVNGLVMTVIIGIASVVLANVNPFDRPVWGNFAALFCTAILGIVTACGLHIWVVNDSDLGGGMMITGFAYFILGLLTAMFSAGGSPLVWTSYGAAGLSFVLTIAVTYLRMPAQGNALAERRDRRNAA